MLNFEIKNLVGTLPVNPDPTRVWKKRDLAEIEGIVVHQAVCHNCSISGMAKYHVTPGPDNHISKDGAPGVCYHYFIDKAGLISQVNHLTDIVWHAGVSKVNAESIGICLIGDFDGPSHKGVEEPSDDQLQALIFLLSNLQMYSAMNIQYIKGHCEVKQHKPDCPGNAIMDLIKEYRN